MLQTTVESAMNAIIQNEVGLVRSGEINETLILFGEGGATREPIEMISDPAQKAAFMTKLAIFDNKIHAMIYVSPFKMVSDESERKAVAVCGYTRQRTIHAINAIEQDGDVVRFRPITCDRLYDEDTVFCNPFKRASILEKQLKEELV